MDRLSTHTDETESNEALKAPLPSIFPKYSVIFKAGSLLIGSFRCVDARLPYRKCSQRDVRNDVIANEIRMSISVKRTGPAMFCTQ